ncbi:SHOCT domain-containing protein [Rhodoferax sediminis]|uniref:SHOCT domain-containing protein n=1 Tax=Rhodoferax sediminis TaxID=2509614 RepID=A0A515D7V5_9BURK|nr:SHOCT domain-containing protein [Rhodoferax sediminis]QDL36437.1 SHOCT domain-containing protein [Rhodoferax sediminis]
MWANMMTGQGWGGMGIGMIGMAIFWILVIVLIVVLVGRMLGFSGGRDKRQEKTALDLLQERYAAGEIEREEYQQKKRDLSS